MQIIDNVFPETTFKHMSDHFIGDFTDAEYKLCNSIIQTGSQEDGASLDTYQFVHPVISDCLIKSPKSLDVLGPLLAYIRPLMIQRIKVNITPRTSTSIETGMHSDIAPQLYPKDSVIKSCIFYLNSTDGCTSFETGEKVESVENRLLIFDSAKIHSGNTCTNKRYRAVVNCVYV